MAKKSHVPKFGNWDNDNVPYTAYFENARKQKTGVKMNPNDPEQNPEAFIRGGGTVAESDQPYPIVVAQPHNNSNKEINSVQDADQGQRIRHGPHQSNNNNSISTTGSYNKSNITSESNSDEKSSSDYSLLQNRRKRSDRKKSATHLVPQPSSTDNSFPHGHARHRSGSTNHSSSSSITDPHHRATSSIPKFGAWNEADPRSGEGFTAIFENVKQEKQIASTNYFPTTTVPQRPCNGSQTKRRTSTTSKMCCCLFPSGSE